MGSEGIQFRPRGTPPPPLGTQTELRIEGMDCGNCVRSVTEALQGVAGISRAGVDLRTATARAYWQPDRPAEPDRLIAAVRKAGYRARLPEDAGSAAHPASSASPAAPHPWKTALWLGIPATILLLAGDGVAGWGMHRPFQWVAWAVATAVQAGVGWRFYRGAWRQAQAGRSNMDTLVSLGSSTAYLWSLWLLFTQDHAHLFFTESVSILTLISVGHALEARMSAKAGDALKALLALAPATARRLDAGGQEQEIPVAQLRTGDRLRIKPGDRIPVDAVVLEGASSADESLLTGEPMPVRKTPGSALLAGSVNVEGSLVVRVNATGEHTTLARIAAVVERAQSSRASVQRLADQVSSVFVPVVVVIACLAAAAWAWNPAMIRHWQAMLAPLLWHPQASTSPMSDAVAAFCSVLIVACPCAMGLATPVALMAGINAAARRGILIRDAIALEKAGRISALAFDKTGTLSTGEPGVVKVLWDAAPEGPELGIAYALAAVSTHPASRAVRCHALAVAPNLQHNHPDVEEIREVPGRGMQGIVNGRRWELGRDSTPPGPEEREGRLGRVALYCDGKRYARFLLSENARPGAAEMAHQLRAAGLSPLVLSGDTQPAVDRLAQEIGIGDAQGELSPQAKWEVIRRLADDGGVAMVGDGINDVPALAAATVGVAMGIRGSAAALAQADVVLVKDRLPDLVEAVHLSRRTQSVVRQNLTIAIGAAALMVIVASFGQLPLALGVFGHEGGTVLVVLNSLRLLQQQAPAGTPLSPVTQTATA